MTLKFHENQNKAQVYGLHNLHRNLWHLFADVAYQFPDREVVVSRWQRLRWTYSELLEITEILARWLVSSGCSKGDYLIAIVGNSAEWALCFWAAVRMGMIFVPLNPNYVGTARQIESLPKKGRSVLVVLNENLAAAMEDVLRPETMARLLRICCAGPDDRQNLRFKLNWFYLPDIITLCVGQAPSLPTTEPVSGEDHLLILFTSGTTTGAPKACALTSSNIWSQTSARLSNEGLHRTLINLPLFHIFGITQALRTLRFGGRIVLPAEKFDVSATLRAIKEERCNHMPVVKAMLEAIIQESPPSAKSDTTSMRIVELGADSVSPADIHRYKEQLGLTVVQSYGMTEGAPIAGWSAADPAASGVGRVYPGANIKICSPEDRLTVFGRNEPGMLHISGPSVISSYLVTDGQADREFYDDGGIRWFITGDRALIDESNALHILGRYKDLIKRGGESICPVEAENWVREKFDMRCVVVGVEDEIAGQVPVMVTPNLVEPTVETLIKKGVKDELGWQHGLDGFLCLPKLGISEFPKMSSGKLNRRSIAELVQSYSDLHRVREGKIVAKLAEIIGCPEADVPLDRPASECMDSIDMLRLLGFINSTGQKIGIGEFGRKTMRQLVAESEANVVQKHANEVKGPITLSDLKKPTGSEEKLQECIDKALMPFGFNRGDVEDIYPVDPWLVKFFLVSSNPLSYYSPSAFTIHGHSAEHVLASLKTTIASWPLFRAFHVELPQDGSFESNVHVVVRPQERLWNFLITSERVEDLDAARSLLFGNNVQILNLTQMLRLTVVEVVASNCVVVIFQLNHSVLDALSMWTFLNQLSGNLQGRHPPFVPSFKRYADEHYRYRRNPSQHASAVECQAKRLLKIEGLKKSFWPKYIEVKSTEEKKFSVEKAVKTCDIPNILELRKKTQVRESILVKSAITLLNAIETGTPAAVLLVVDAGRYLPSSGEMSFTKGSDGPTISSTVDIVTIDPEETVMDFLQRVDRQQEELSSQVHTPWLQVLGSLPREHIAAFLDITTRQCYNWDVTMRLFEDHKRGLKELRFFDRADTPNCACFWNCGMVNDTQLRVKICWNGPHFNSNKANRIIDQLMTLVGLLSDPGNLDQKVGTVVLDKIKKVDNSAQ